VPLSRVMVAPMMNLTLKRPVIVTVLLLAVVASGSSQIEIHTHPDAHFGHAHDVQHHDEADGGNPGDLDDPGSIGMMHAHDVGTTTLTLASAFDVDIVTYWRANGGIPPQTAKPPDSVIPPLYRPPIV